MKEVIVKVYQYAELSDSAKEKAQQWYASASSHDLWWEQVYEDAENVGIKITAFDCGRGNHIEGKLENGIIHCCELIMNGEYRHGETCDTYKLAAETLPKVQAHIDQMSAYENAANYDYDRYVEMEDKLEEVTAEFERAILEEYLSSLRKEHEYIYSEAQIVESIESNEYEFTEDGARFAV